MSKHRMQVTLELVKVEGDVQREAHVREELDLMLSGTTVFVQKGTHAQPGTYQVQVVGGKAPAAKTPERPRGTRPNAEQVTAQYGIDPHLANLMMGS